MQLVYIQVALMGGPEYARWVGINSLQPVGIFLPGSPLYPGTVPRSAVPAVNGLQRIIDREHLQAASHSIP